MGIRFQTRGEQTDVGVGRAADSRGATWRGDEKLASESNYFIGNDSRKWRARVPHFARAESSNAARGVGVAVYGNEEGVEYDLRLAPEADVSKLRLALTGARSVRLDSSGNLLLAVGGKEMRMKRPAVYEYEEAATHWHSKPRQRHRALGSGGPRTHSTNKPRKLRSPNTERRHRKPKPLSTGHSRRAGRRVQAEYVLEADGTVGFRLGPHDPDAVLVVDPSLSVTYATFLGGAGTDAAASIAVDSGGKIYVGGAPTTSESSFSLKLPEGSGPADGPAEFFIAKINPGVTGPSSLVYLTFLGGSGSQSRGLIAVDGSGNAAIMGTTTSTDFPVTDLSGPTNGLISGSGNDVVVKANSDPTGGSIYFSRRFLAGSGAESLNGTGGIAFDSSGDVYIASDSTHETPVDGASTDLPVTAGAYQSAWDGESSDGFVAIFQPPSTSGGAGHAEVLLAFWEQNSAGAARRQRNRGGWIGERIHRGVGVKFGRQFSKHECVSGVLWWRNLRRIFDEDFAAGQRLAGFGLRDADRRFGKRSGFGCGARLFDHAERVCNGDHAIIQFSCTWSDRGVSGHRCTRQQRPMLFWRSSRQDALSGQTSLKYSTYLGGSETDAGQGIAVAAQNAVYVTGKTTSWDFPWHDNLQPFNGAGDAFVAKPTRPSGG